MSTGEILGKVLVVDDDPLILDLLDQELTGVGHIVERALRGEDALIKLDRFSPDVVLLDYMMPEMNGLEVLRRLREDDRYKALPVILVTGHGAQEDKVRGLDAGADDYVVKPFDPAELLARVRSMLRIKQMHDALEDWNRTLEARVEAQVAEIQRLARLKSYLAPQIAEAVLATADEDLFKGHRREITVVFLDLQGFAQFVESVEPEEVFTLLQTFHAEMGRIVFAFEGTIGDMIGDGMMVFFNDPITSDHHTEDAVRMVMSIRDRVRHLREGWLKAGYNLDLTAGLAAGYATLGEIGFESRRQYAAVGSTINLAVRFEQMATAGQILTNRRTLNKVESIIEAEPLGEVQPKGFARPVEVFNLVRLKAASAEQAFAPLSRREAEVAALVAQGLSNKEIATALFVSERTAESHIQNILNKLGFHARTQIASWSIARGLAQVPSS